MGAFVKCQIQYQRTTGLPKDVQTNTLYFADFGIGGTALGTVADALTPVTDFVNTIDAQVGDDLFTVDVFLDWYDMSDAEPRVPIQHDEITWTPSVNQPLPEECSAVISFHAEPVSGEPMARRRGRIFTPTLTESEIESSAGVVRLNSGCRLRLKGAAEALMNDLEATDSRWCVFSPKTESIVHDLNQSFNRVVGGWVDDSPDTQRRRGHEAGLRSTW